MSILKILNFTHLASTQQLAQQRLLVKCQYRQDEPLQIDDVELLFAAMPQQLANAYPDDYSFFDGISQMPIYGPGEQAQGFILSDTVQAQVTFTHLFGPMFGC